VSDVKRRSYRTSIRRGDAPHLVCTAAQELFATKGYLATSIEDIAAGAGVARPTVFSAVGTKPAILKAVIDQAFAGDELPAAVADRSWFKEAFEEQDPVRAVRLHARNICRIAERVAPLLRALETAAAVDPDAASLHDQVREQRRTGTASIAADLAEKAQLRCDQQTLADLLFTLPPDAYLRLVHEERWPPKKFEAWLAETMLRLCLP
jgi:TetR/AcrR family transcriptional regulator, regulator of autoinduction and epiphytic fitness